MDSKALSGFTPAPWQVTGTLGKLAITMPHDSIGIAPYTICHIWPHIETGTPEANATLIASAPELLKACEQVLNDMENNRAYLKKRSIPTLRIAIAKAKGQSR